MASRVGVLAGWHSSDESMYGIISAGTPSSDGSGTLTVPMDGSHLRVLTASGFAGAKALVYVGVKDVTVPDWGGAATDESGIVREATAAGLGAAAWAIFVVDIDGGTTYKIRLKTNGTTRGTGSTAFTYGVGYDLRVRYENTGGIAGDYVVDYGGSEEINVSVAAGVLRMSDGLGFETSNVDAASSVTYKEAVILDADDGSRRPDVDTFNILRLGLNGDGADADFATRDYLRIDDWKTGDSDEGTTHDASNINTGTTERNSYDVETHTLSNIMAVAAFAEFNPNFDAKDSDYYIFISDGAGTPTRSEQVVGSGLPGGVYLNRRAVFNAAQDGTAWGQSDLDSLEIGFRITTNVDDQNMNLTAMQGEVLDYTNDPEAGPSARRVMVIS